MSMGCGTRHLSLPVRSATRKDLMKRSLHVAVMYDPRHAVRTDRSSVALRDADEGA